MTTATTQAQSRRERLLVLLADGTFHSGERLAKQLRISRGGIWKLIRSLRELGIEIQSVPRQGYRLPTAVDLLEKKNVVEAMAPSTRTLIRQTDIFLSIDSTNRYVGEQSIDAGTGEDGANGQVCLAELQTAGRGRRGRHWIAPFGSGICLSIGWQFAEAPPTFSALSLAVGVAVTRALRRFNANINLKWPNDLIWQQRKLGGILLEMRGESAGPAHVVIGIGLNVKMPAAARIALAEQQAALIADVHEVLRERTPSRSALAGALVDEVVTMLQTFASCGFAPFINEWRKLDALADAAVKVITGTATISGLARGVDDDGALLVEVNGTLNRFVSGEVSLRAIR
jgi:BirA family biotin operon repressor/biotin-[acetyl-CoA-carboxylase] ligase